MQITCLFYIFLTERNGLQGHLTLSGTHIQTHRVLSLRGHQIKYVEQIVSGGLTQDARWGRSFCSINLKYCVCFLCVSTIRSAWPLTLRVPWLLRAAWTPWLNYGMLRVGKRCPHWQYVSSCVFSVFLFNHKHSLLNHFPLICLSPTGFLMISFKG